MGAPLGFEYSRYSNALDPCLFRCCLKIGLAQASRTALAIATVLPRVGGLLGGSAEHNAWLVILIILTVFLRDRGSDVLRTS
jgi:hypothetical protein